MKPDLVFSDIEKQSILAGLDNLRASMRRLVAKQPSGSSTGNAILDDIHFVDLLINKVGKL